MMRNIGNKIKQVHGSAFINKSVHASMALFFVKYVPKTHTARQFTTQIDQQVIANNKGNDLFKEFSSFSSKSTIRNRKKKGANCFMIEQQYVRSADNL